MDPYAIMGVSVVLVTVAAFVAMWRGDCYPAAVNLPKIVRLLMAAVVLGVVGGLVLGFLVVLVLSTSGVKMHVPNEGL